MFKTLLTLPVAAIAVTSFAPIPVLEAGHGLVEALLVLTPPIFVTGAGLQLLRRNVL